MPLTSTVRQIPRLQADHVYGRLAELARRRHRKAGKTAAGKALLANLRASSLGERRPSDHEMTTWDKVRHNKPDGALYQMSKLINCIVPVRSSRVESLDI